MKEFVKEQWDFQGFGGGPSPQQAVVAIRQTGKATSSKHRVLKDVLKIKLKFLKVWTKFSEFR